MANEIASWKADGKDRVETESLDRDFASIPGRYFRAVDGIGERTETAMRDVSRWSGRDHTVGQEEVAYSARRSVAAGTVLLAVRLRFVDDELHSVELAAHPSDPDRSNLAFMADEFFTLFVAEEDGEKVREAEIAEVHARIVDVQARLASPPSGMAALPPPGQSSPSAVSLVKAIDHKEDIAGKAKAIALAAEERRRFIEAETAEITAQTALLANFYHEKATAALALVGDSIQFAKDVTEGLTTLSLYTGEGVTVERLCEGASADPSEPLTLYQDRLYLDEELAVESLAGGFDFRGLGCLGDILSADRGLLDRMVPAARGAVLVRVRRRDMNYFDGPSGAIVDAVMNERNHKVYLLVRDGENVHLVNSEVTTDNAERLFPTRKEIADIFKSWGREIRPDHLDYSKARTDFDRNTVFYKRMLLMLWGLSDRLSLFGDFYDRQRFDNWYDGEFQAERIAYVYDGEGTLGVDRPSFFDWIRQNNRFLQAGSRIAAVWNSMVNPSSAPACFSNRYVNGEPPRIYAPTSTDGIARVERRGEDLVVRCEVGGYMQGSGKPRKFETRIDLAMALRYEGSSSCLCLDRVSVEDLDYYLNSRKERRNYAEYFHLFKTARAFLAQEEETQREAIRSLLDDLGHAGIEEGRAAAALNRAVALWRAQNAARLVGGDGWTASDRSTVLDVAYALSGKQDGLLERVRKDVPDCVPVEIRVDGRGAFWLYREPRAGEETWLQRAIGPGHVARVRLRVGRDRVSESGEPRFVHLTVPDFDPAAYLKHRLPPLPVREETVVSDRERSDAWKGRRMPGYLSHDEALAMETAAGHDASGLAASISVRDVAREVLRVIEDNRTGTVARTSYTVALGVVSYRFEGREAARLLCLEGNGVDVLAASGPEGEALARRIVEAAYENPAMRLESIGKIAASDGGLPLSLSLVSPEFAGSLREGWAVLRASQVESHVIRAVRKPAAFSDKLPERNGSIAEAVLGDFARHGKDGLADVKVVFRSDANRKLAESWFAKEAAKAVA